MTIQQKLLVGALGGITPTLLIMYRLDYSDLLNTAEPGLVVGGCIRALFAAAFGAFMVFLNRSEENVYKLFQLGIAAPGLLSIMITDVRPTAPGAQQEDAVTTMAAPVPAQTGLSTFLFSSAMAQDQGFGIMGGGLRQAERSAGGSSGVKVEQFTAPEERFMTQVVRGITGALPDNRFYVVHSSYATEAEAVQVAKEQHARVFIGSDPQRPYNVVIAAQVDMHEAQRVNAKLNSTNNRIIEVR